MGSVSLAFLLGAVFLIAFVEWPRTASAQSFEAEESMRAFQPNGPTTTPTTTTAKPKKRGRRAVKQPEGRAKKVAPGAALSDSDSDPASSTAKPKKRGRREVEQPEESAKKVAPGTELSDSDSDPASSTAKPKPTPKKGPVHKPRAMEEEEGGFFE